MGRGDAIFDQQIVHLYEYSFEGYGDFRASKKD